MFIFSGVSFTFLHGDPFFSIEADPVFWVVYGIKIPVFIVACQWVGFLLDFSVILLLLFVIRYPFNRNPAVVLFLLLMLYYLTLMGYLTHRNYQFGFFMVFVPFIFKSECNKYFAYEATRYFLLIFYVTAALLKLSNNALSDSAHFSHLLTNQFTPYFLEGNTGIRTNVNLYLIYHPGVSHALFLASFVIELVIVIGFFTKRFDSWLAILLLGFHFMNWFIMDIAPFGQITFICLLFYSRVIKRNYDGARQIN